MITLAKDSQKEEMIRLWQTCFGDPARYIRNFFSRKFEASGAMVYLSEQKIVSMLFMLPAAIRMNAACEPVQYIYAVCTHPDYRKRGIMGELMESARDQALGAGQRFSVLLPASDDLYLYYGRLGYLEYFKRRRIHIETHAGAGGGQSQRETGQRPPDPAPERIHRIRQSLFGEREGSVLWDEPAVAYAISALEVYGGLIRCFEYGGRQGYAMGYVDQAKNTAIVQELAFDSALWPQAAQVVADHLPAASIQLSLPADPRPDSAEDLRALAGLGAITEEAVERWGMIRPLNEDAAHALEQSRERTGTYAPYLGLALD
jgi:GNAT superfamily N-acetyltransferase